MQVMERVPEKHESRSDAKRFTGNYIGRLEVRSMRGESKKPGEKDPQIEIVPDSK